MVALLQKDDVAGHFRSGVLLEGVIRQSDGPNEVGALGQIFADGGVFLIQSALAGDERHDTTRAHLVQRFAKEIVVDQPVVLVVPLIQHLEIPKGDVAHGHIKKAVGHLYGFKAVYGNAGVLVKLPRNPPGNGIQLHAVGFAARHICGEQAEEIAGAAGRLYVPTDFDTKEKAFFGAKAAEKDLKQGLPRSYSDFGSPCFMCLVILLPLGNAAGYQPCGVAILE